MDDAHHEPEPAEALVERALAKPWDSDERWVHIRDLHVRSDAATVEVLFALLESPVVDRRELAVDALGQFATDRDRPVDVARPFGTAIVDRLIMLAAEETDHQVLQAIAMAFNHLGDAGAIPVLAGWRAHPDENVRHAVAVALGSHETDLAVEVLIELTTDDDSDVRDWATFGLGVTGDRDTPEIRAALMARLDDEDEQTRGEALVGLAERGDERILPVLLAEVEALDDDADWPTLDDAVYALAVTTRHPALRSIVVRARDRWLAERPGRAPYGNHVEALEAYGLEP